MTLSLSRMLSAEKSAKDSAQSPACNKKPLPSLTRASPAFNDRASPANTSGGMRRSSSTARSTAAGSGQSGCCAARWWRQLAGSQSKLPNGTGALMSEVGAGLFPRVVAHLERAPLAHVLELTLGLHLLREQGRLDAVEQPFQPAHELGLRDAQLGFTGGVARERHPHLSELLAQIGRQDLFELVDRSLVDLLERAAAFVVER